MKLLKKLVETYSPSHDEDNAVQFFIKELKLMFFDPTDLIVEYLNRLLINNKTIKFIFS